MDLKQLNSEPLLLKYPSTFNPWNVPECSGRILFVGGIHKECEQIELFHYLKQFGEVDWIRIEKDQSTGQGRGHAFAIMATKEGHEKILGFKKHQLRELYIGISLWKSSKEYLNEKDQSMRRKIFVKRLSINCTDSDLYQYFSAFGLVEKAEIRRNHADGKSRQIGFVIFQKESEAELCLSWKLHTMNGREIVVKKCRNPNEVMKERSLLEGGSDKHSYTISEDSSFHSYQDWSFFTAPMNLSTSGANGSFSLKEAEDQPSFNVSNTSFLPANLSRVTSNSVSEPWAKKIVPIAEEDETCESNFSSNVAKMISIPTLRIVDKDFYPDFFIEPRMKFEMKAVFFIFPGYV